jgi:subfamily B ATP-binding cassette protein MsbA
MPSDSPHDVTPDNNDGVHVYRRLLSYALPYWKLLIFVALGLAVTASTEPLFAWVMKPLLDEAILEKNAAVIQWVPLAILGIFFIRGIASFFATYYVTYIGRAIIKEIRQAVFQKLLLVPISYYDHANSGELLARINYHTEQVASAATSGFSILIRDSLIVIGLLGYMLYLSWQLTLGVLVIGPFVGVVIAYVTKRLRNLSQKVQDSVSDTTQVAGEIIDGNKVIRIFNGEDYETRRFHEANERNRQLFMKRSVTELMSTPIVQFMVAVALAGIVFIATRESTLSALSPGTFVSFMFAMMMLLTPIKRLTQVNATLQNGIAAGSNIFNLLDEVEEKDPGTRRLVDVKGNIDFNNISFSYEDNDKTVIKKVSFSAQAGQSIALVGKSGSGKTTLVNLLPRFYDYQQGDILLDGVPLKALKLKHLRENITYVGQDIVLFNDTIRNNIAYGDMREYGEEALYKAAEAAHALEFINKLPDGFDTLIGDNGVLLSGGQRQRLSIARAILSPAPILILDEATSALDTESERHIQAALDSLMQDRTTFIIAHRLSTIEQADKIIVMNEGEIVEEGTHQSLLGLNGHYAKLHRMQFTQTKTLNNNQDENK